MNESLSISLTPLSMGQMLDRAFRLYRAHFAKLVGIAAVAQILSFIFQAGITSFTTLSLGINPNQPPSPFLDDNYGIFIVLGIVSFIVIIAVSLLTQAALAKGISEAMFGKSFSVQSTYQDILPYLGKLFLQLLALIGLSIAAGIWLIIPCVGWLTGPGMFVFISFISAFAVPILIIEQKTPTDAIYRAWYLLRKRFWYVLGYVFLIGLMTAIISGGLTALVTFGGQALVATNPSTGVLLTTQLVQIGVTAIVSAIILPLTIIAYLIFYFDLRIRTEGFDLTLQTHEGSDLSPADIVKITPSQADEKFMRRDDMLNFLYLSLIILALYAVLVGVIVGIGALVATQSGDIFNSFPID
ncbi:MAG: hypothetical protein AAF902_16615 [Chloroflexota bacterium]